MTWALIQPAGFAGAWLAAWLSARCLATGSFRLIAGQFLEAGGEPADTPVVVRPAGSIVFYHDPIEHRTVRSNSMKILHVTPAFHPAYVYGGPIESVYQLCRHLAQQGCDVQVLTSNANGRDRELDVPCNQDVRLEERLHVRYCHRALGQVIAPALISSLLAYVRKADLVHLTGVYSFPTIPTLLACRILNKPLVWSPRGALQRWQGSRRIAPKLLWERVCWAMAPRKLIFHVTAGSEAQSTRDRFPWANSVLVPNGVAIPELPASRERDDEVLSMVFLGRIDRKKGIENLLAACSRLNGRVGEWSLTIAGGGEASYVGSLQALIDGLALQHRIRMIGEVKRDALAPLFSRADVVVVPSHVENFCMVVAEALAYGVPVIASKGTPWAEIEKRGCGLWVENSAEALSEAIVHMRHCALGSMGALGRDWMKEEFAWEAIAGKMLRLYESVPHVRT